MYPQGNYKGGLGDTTLPFMDPTMSIDITQALAAYNPAATALTAMPLVQNYDSQGSFGLQNYPNPSSQPTTKVGLNTWALNNQGTLALVGLAVIALAILKK